VSPGASQRIAVIIPARFASERLPGKPLADICGKPMVVRVLERVKRARVVERALVATDDERIANAVREHGGEVVMTSEHCASGTDRVAEAARSLPEEFGVIFNVQGDEPLIEPIALELLAGAFRDDAVKMATLVYALPPTELQKPQVVKVVRSRKHDALYFSRSPIPMVRDGGRHEYLGHVGIYGFRREFLQEFSKLPPTPLERAERLEQLRALEYGVPIRVVATPYRGFGVDTPEDLERARTSFAQLKEE
jgi:3-deoxy-manno-octulosonate cytidylyltransferase (CMP-KDO synthetase)